MRRSRSRSASQGLFHSLGVVAVVIGIVSAGGRAQAQGEPPEAGFGDKGHFALGADRLFGYTHVSQEQTSSIAGASTMTTTFNSISVLGSPIHNIASVFSFPRVGFDAVVGQSISLGGALTYFHLSQSGNANSNGVTASGFLIAPRLGFAARLGQSVWLWPRVGITYASFSTDIGGGVSTSSDLLAATIEAPIAVALGPQAILLIGPSVDLGLSGSTKLNGDTAGTNSSDIKETDIGLQVGFVFYL